MATIKYHFAVPFYSGCKAACGRTRTKNKITDRAKWRALARDQRCNDCHAAVERNGAPRPDRITAVPRRDGGAGARAHASRTC